MNFNNKRNRILAFIIALVFVITTGVSAQNADTCRLITEEDVITRYVNQPLNKENVARSIKELGILYPDVVFRQAMIESGHLRSGLARKGHNLFGMRCPNSRKTHAIRGKYKGYACYESWIYSVADYKIWQSKRKVTSDYYGFLRRVGYAANPRYCIELRGYKMPSDLKNILDTTEVLVGKCISPSNNQLIGCINYYDNKCYGCWLYFPYLWNSTNRFMCCWNNTRI